MEEERYSNHEDAVRELADIIFSVKNGDGKYEGCYVYLDVDECNCASFFVTSNVIKEYRLIINFGNHNLESFSDYSGCFQFANKLLYDFSRSIGERPYNDDERDER